MVENPPAPAAMLSLPLELLPTREQILEVYRAAAVAEVRRHFEWLTLSEARAHLKVSRRTFERKKKSLGIPVAELDGVKVIARQDLDAILIAHTTTPRVAIIQFPTQIAKHAANKAA